MQRPITHCIPIPHCILLVQPKLSIDYDRINKTLVPFHPCSLYNKPGVGRVQRPITHCIPIPHCILLVQPKLSIDYDRINKTLVPFHSCSLSYLRHCILVGTQGISFLFCFQTIEVQLHNILLLLFYHIRLRSSLCLCYTASCKPLHQICIACSVEGPTNQTHHHISKMFHKRQLII